MEYEKIINLLDNVPNQPSKFRTKNWVETNDDGRGTCNKDIQIQLKNAMLKSSLCDYRDAYIIVSGTITVVETRADAASIAPDRINKQATFKNCASFTDCITEINNTQVDSTKDLDLVRPMYNLIEYSDNYSKTSGSLFQFCRDEPNSVVTESESFKFKSKFLDNTSNEGIINAKHSCATKILK